MKIFRLTAVLFLLSVQLAAQDTTRLRLLFAGDVMGHDSQIASAYDSKTGTYDYNKGLQFIAPYIRNADLAIANLEVTLAGRPYKGYPQFSSPDALAIALKEAGFDALVTANNHCVDRGKRGLERTVRVLDSLSIPHTGTFIDSTAKAASCPLMLYRNGFSVALLNYTYGTNGLPVYKPNIVNLIDTAKISADLRTARANKPDVIIVFMHWGGEYERLPSKWQKSLTEFCFARGAQLVIGAHPHVIQPMEWRKKQNRFVAYSLGNFVSGQRKQYTDGGSLAYLELEKIRFAPDSAITTIDSASYLLEWVYRTADARKDYFILPAPAESSNLAFIKDAASRDAYRLFLSDSRALSAKYNINVPEIRTPAPSEIVTYRVLLMTTEPNEDPWKILTSQREYLWGVDRYDGPDGKVYWTSGNFASETEADAYRDRYISRHPEAVVVRFVNDRR